MRQLAHSICDDKSLVMKEVMPKPEEVSLFFYPRLCILGLNVVDKFTKLNKIGFSVECFTNDSSQCQNLLLG